MRQVFVVFVGVALFASVARTQTSKVDRRADEATIRALGSGPGTNIEATDDVIFWSGAFPRPNVRGKTEVAPFPQVDQRRNERITREVLRVEVAEAGDMAYEFGSFTLSFDAADTKKHVTIPGSLLRVWKKVNGEWRVAAAFQHEHDVYKADTRSRSK